MSETEGPRPAASALGSTLDEIIALLEARFGLHFEGYRRSTLERRLSHHLARRAEPSLETFRVVMGSDAELAALARALLVQTTALVRHEPSYALLRRVILPDLLRARRKEAEPTVRAWVAGCSTGEEAFALAMALDDARERTGVALSVSVLGSDVDPHAIENARRGIVHPGQLGPLPPDFVERYLARGEGGFHVAPTIRGLVTFGVHDLLTPRQPAPKEAVLASFDIVSCCNVLLYFEPEVREGIFQRLLETTRPGGYLVLGSAEAPPAWASSLLSPVTSGVPIYRVVG